MSLKSKKERKGLGLGLGIRLQLGLRLGSFSLLSQLLFAPFCFLVLVAPFWGKCGLVDSITALHLVAQLLLLFMMMMMMMMMMMLSVVCCRFEWEWSSVLNLRLSCEWEIQVTCWRSAHTAKCQCTSKPTAPTDCSFTSDRTSDHELYDYCNTLLSEHACVCVWSASVACV